MMKCFQFCFNLAFRFNLCRYSLGLVLLWVAGDAILWDYRRGEVFHKITIDKDYFLMPGESSDEISS